MAGSVILAGVLLKLGGYGFIRFSWALFPEASEFYSPLIQTLSLLAVIYGSLTTCRQIDLKRVIAYSSIAHMGLVTLGVFTHTVQGLVGSIYLMLAHGLVSSALFIMVTLLYERHLTRLVKYYRGMAITMPLFGGVLLTLVLANIGLPLSCNFMGEFITLLSAFEYSYLSAIVAALGMVLSAAYGLYMFNRVCFGNMTHYLYRPRDLNRREFFSVLPLIVLTYYMGIFPAPLLDTIQITTSLLEI